MKGTKAVLRIVFCLTVIACVQQRAFAAGAAVTVDYRKPKQTIEGFGAGIPWVAGNINNFSAADQTTILNNLYSTTQPRAALFCVAVNTYRGQFNPAWGR